MPSPTELTLRQLRADGWVCEVVERWNPHSKRRKDLFGVADILAFRHTVLLVQATTSSNVAARLRKCRRWEHAKAWPGGFEVWGWRKKDGKWIVRRVEV